MNAWGDKGVEELLQHYIRFFNSRQAVAVLQQWKQFKKEMVAHFPQLLTMRFNAFWHHIFKHFGYRYDQLCKLVRFILLVPCDTSDCERGFSLMNLLLTALRNNLGEKHLNDLMIICSLGPSIHEFDPKPVLKYWHAQKKKGRFLNAMFNDF